MHQIERTELERFFELSLAIGTSLHTQENARVFLSKLVESTSLTFAGLWLRSPSGVYQLEFAYPEQEDCQTALIPENHNTPKALEAQPFFTEVLTNEAPEQPFVYSDHLGSGTYGYFQLPVFSFVQIFEAGRGRSGESELGKGTTFIFKLSLPISEKADNSQVAAPSGNAGHKGLLRSLWVLLVEDNPMNQKLASHILKAWGCHFEVANDGEEAIEKSRKRHFDIILMDIHMPKLDGCEATAQIRADKQNINQNTLIIGLTAAAILDEKQRAIESGMNQFITKPFSPSALSELILNSLQLSHSSEKKQLDMNVEHENNPTPVSVDLTYLNEFSGGDKGFIREIIQTFLQEAPRNVARLSEGLGQEDWDTVYRAAHQLKPNYMMLGMPAQQEAALSIEKLAKSGPEKTEIDEMITRLVADTRKAFPLLEEKLSELEA